MPQHRVKITLNGNPESAMVKEFGGSELNSTRVGFGILMDERGADVLSVLSRRHGIVSLRLRRSGV